MSTSNIHSKLINNESVYDSGIHGKLKSEVIGWNDKPPHERERILKKYTICVLLSNQERLPVKRRFIQTQIAHELIKRRRIDNTQEAGPSNIEDDVTNLSQALEDSIIEDTMYDNDALYRYLVVYTMPNSRLVCSNLASMWGVDIIYNVVDLIDRKERKFITLRILDSQNPLVKITSLIPDGSSPHQSLITVNMETLEITYYNKADKMPGEEKVIKFISTRKHFLSEMNVTNIDVVEIEDLFEHLFVSKRMNDRVEEWKSGYLSKCDEPTTDISDHIKRIAEKNSIARINEMADMIVDVENRQAEPMKWNGRLLPPPMDFGVWTGLEKDEEMVTLVLNGRKFTALKPEDETYTKVMEIIQSQWNRNPSTFRFMTRKEIKRRVNKELSNVLGVDRKDTIRNDAALDLKQEEYGGRTEAKYHPWMSDLIDALQGEIRDGAQTNPDEYQTEMPSDHPINKIMSPIIDEFFNKFNQTETSRMINKYQQFYSRVSGAYLNRDDSKSKHSNVVIFPILSTHIRDGVIQRYVTGVCIRGPHFAKAPTDRINLLTLEMINKEPRGRYLSQFVKKPIFMKDDSGNYWMLRQNTISKAENSYLTFINNSLFMPVNSLGEIILSNNNVHDGDSLALISEKYLNEYWGWVMDRINESTLMAILGNSQEEGALAQLRKLYMLMLNWKRGQNALIWDQKGFVEKFNECIIDSPLAIYFAFHIKRAMVKLSGLLNP